MAPEISAAQGEYPVRAEINFLPSAPTPRCPGSRRSLREKHPQMELSRPPRHRATFPALGGFTVKAAEGNVSKLISVKSVSAKASVDRTAANYPNIFSLLCRYTGKLKHFAPGFLACLGFRVRVVVRRPNTGRGPRAQARRQPSDLRPPRLMFLTSPSCSHTCQDRFPRERESNFPAQPGELAEDGTVARRREPR
ncbi:hypothetical protein Bbelb_398450 [Branchiostoma belcheri]|nr:hypothetical protein Bbelb_398450 [Branchiostoma belcheri]